MGHVDSRFEVCRLHTIILCCMTVKLYEGILLCKDSYIMKPGRCMLHIQLYSSAINTSLRYQHLSKQMLTERLSCTMKNIMDSNLS
jgi:hypothetical protein